MSKKPTYKELEQRAQELERAGSERKQAEEALRESEERFSAMFKHMGTGRILFVDDEAPIANIGRQMFRRLGYDDDFDLVITDMTMPHLRGDELARAVMDVRPDMPVILCTGYSDMINKEKLRAMGIRRVLEKPVGMLEMAGAVYDILSGEDHSSGDG